MSPQLVVALGVAGGSPPPTQEILRVYDDGRVVALVGNAWPEGTPQDAAGYYETRLPPAEVSALSAWLAEHQIANLDPEYGPRRADSGVTAVTLPVGTGTRRIRWGAFADVPAALPALRRRLRDLLSETRRQPVQAVQLALETATDRVASGQTFPVVITLTGRGQQPVRVALAGTPDGAAVPPRLHAAPHGTVNPAAAPPREVIHRARPLALETPTPSPPPSEPVILAPGQTWQVPAVAAAISGPPGAYWLYLFAYAAVEVVVDGAPLTLHSFLAARPVAVTVEPA
jgi:hypothetical protein